MKRLAELLALAFPFATAYGLNVPRPGARILSRPSNVARQDNDGIHLAVSPVCGPLSGNTSDVNTGIHLPRIKTIVAFGVSSSCPSSAFLWEHQYLMRIFLLQDSYTDGGRDDGGPLAPPIVVPPDAEAGGRSTNGPVWVEDLAAPYNATLMDYAVRIGRI